jgi:hypothetical protein
MSTASTTARSLVAKASSTTTPKTKTTNKRKYPLLVVHSDHQGVFFLRIGERPLTRKIIMKRKRRQTYEQITTSNKTTRTQSMVIGPLFFFTDRAIALS